MRHWHKWQSPDTARMKGKRDRALLALLLACGLRRHEAANLRVEDLEQREEHWAIVDLVGKAGHIRTVPIPDWVYLELVAWLSSASINRGKVFRRISRMGRALGDGISEKAIWHVVRSSALQVGIAALAPHDLRRTCARLCRSSGGELDQIQLLLGHVSIQTTDLGSRQRIRSAVNDRIGIEPGSCGTCESQEIYFSPEPTSVGSCRASTKDYNHDKIDELIPALLWLTPAGPRRAWKSYDSDAMAHLHAKGYISDPRSRAKSIAFSEEGERRAQELFERHVGR